MMRSVLRVLFDILSRTAWRTARSPACSWSDRGRARGRAGLHHVRDTCLPLLAARRCCGHERQQLPTRVCDRCWRLLLWAMINESPSDMLSPANAAAVCVRRAEPAAVWRRDRHALRCPHEYASRELAPFHVGNTVCGRVSAPIARCCSLEPSPSRRHQRPRMLDFTSPVPCVSGLHQHHSTTASTPHSISAAASA